VFPVLIEICDAPVELGSLRVGHGYVLIFKALPEVLDQIEPLARREPSQRWREIIHVVQHGERKRVRQFAFRPARRAPHPGRHHRGTPGAIKSVWQAALSGLASLGVEGLAVQARTAVALLDALGIARAHWVGNSQGGQSAMVAAITYPERVRKFVMGGSHIGTGGDRYLMANRPSEGSRATRRALDDPSRENIRHYLCAHIDDESLVTDELVDYIHRAHTWSQEFIEARRQSVSLPHDYTPDLPGIQAPVLLIHGRYDRMVPFEVSIAILNHIADSRLVLLNNCGHRPPFEKPAEWTAQVLAFLKGY